MTYEDEFSIILNSIAKLSSLGFKKWFANMDEIDDEKSNLRILGICHNELIIAYDYILPTEECKFILKLLFGSDINFVYITGFIDLK